MPEHQYFVTINNTNKVAIEPGVSTISDVILVLTLELNVAVAINDKIVGHRLWPTTVLAGGEQLSIFGAIAGG